MRLIILVLLQATLLIADGIQGAIEICKDNHNYEYCNQVMAKLTVKELKNKCESINAPYCYLLGLKYKTLNPNSDKFINEEIEAYKKECYIGHTLTCATLARIYGADKVFEDDKIRYKNFVNNTTSAIYYMMDCKRSPLSCSIGVSHYMFLKFLNEMYIDNQFVTYEKRKDVDDTIKLMSESIIVNIEAIKGYCNEGKELKNIKKYGAFFKQGQSCTELGQLYLYGDVVRLDRMEAKKYFGYGCDLQDAEGCKLYKK